MINFAISIPSTRELIANAMSRPCDPGWAIKRKKYTHTKRSVLYRER